MLGCEPFLYDLFWYAFLWVGVEASAADGGTDGEGGYTVGDGIKAMGRCCGPCMLWSCTAVRPTSSASAASTTMTVAMW